MAGLLGKLNQLGNFINNTATPHINGLLGNRAFNLGVGLLAESGPQYGQRRSFGQVLAGAQQYANNAQAQHQNLQFNRNALQQQHQQQQAIKQFQGLLKQPPAASVPPSIRRPGAIQSQNNQMMGLLGQIAPGQMAQQMIAQQFANPNPQTSASFADWVAMGGNPQDIEGFAKFKSGGRGDLQALQAQIEMMRLQQMERDADSQAEEERVSTLSRRRGITSSVNTIASLAEDLQTISGTFLEPGMVAPELRRDMSAVGTAVRSALGGNTEEAKKVIAAYDRLNKNLNSLVLDTIDSHSGGLTNPQIAILQEASASTNIRPEAIANILNTMLDARSFSAELEKDWELSNPDVVGSTRGILNSISFPSTSNQNEVDWNEINASIGGNQ